MTADSAEPFRWRKVAVAVYGPSLLASIGTGAIAPLIALSARDLGANPGIAALIVSLLGIGTLLGDLPAGALAARIGERWGLVIASLLEVVAMLIAFFARTPQVLALAILLAGLAAAVFSLARMTYLTSAVPLRIRARAMSTMGGMVRIGWFVGPFAAAWIVTSYDIQAAYLFAAAVGLLAAGLAAFVPDIEQPPRSITVDKEPNGADRNSAAAQSSAVESALPAKQPSVLSVLIKHRRILYTLGTGMLALSATRATRSVIVPLWADSQGIDATTTSIIFGISAGVDMLLFYPGGAIMDRYGRAAVAIPAMLIMGTGFALLPLTHTAVSVGLVACLMGLGNGISAGVVFTLGADSAPVDGRSQFLGGWRMVSDLGGFIGPLVISGVTAFATLGVAALAMGVVAWSGAAWLSRFIRPKTG